MNYIIDFVRNFIDEIKERVRNPRFFEKNSTHFGGAFFASLIFYNWKLIFSIFSFDDFENRLSKIEIIEKFLKSEPWFERIGYPLLFAFLSIVVFHVASILSLGIKIFFNRWFKALILYITDRGKLINKEIFEKLNYNFSKSQKNLEGLKEELRIVIGRNSELDNQLDKLTEDFRSTSSKNEELEKEIVRLNSLTTTSTTTEKPQNSNIGLSIIYARYESIRGFIEVTEIVNELLKNNKRFVVNNSNLLKDPSPYSIKDLLVIYSVNGENKSIVVLEGSELVKEEENLKIIETTESKKKAEYKSNERKISSIFEGPWKFSFIADNGRKVEEIFFLDFLGNYYVNNKMKYYLSRILINKDPTGKNIISFDKIDLNRKIVTKENLKENGKGTYTGTDSKGKTIHYSKIEI